MLSIMFILGILLGSYTTILLWHFEQTRHPQIFVGQKNVQRIIPNLLKVRQTAEIVPAEDPQEEAVAEILEAYTQERQKESEYEEDV